MEKQERTATAANGILNLQFGHGTEPWRNAKFEMGVAERFKPSIRPRHGAVEKPDMGDDDEGEPDTPSIRPRHGAVEKHAGRHNDTERLLLQFGHGTEPWRNANAWAD